MEIEPPMFREGLKYSAKEEHYVYTIELVPDEEAKLLSEVPIVMIHGYGGSGMIFY